MVVIIFSILVFLYAISFFGVGLFYLSPALQINFNVESKVTFKVFFATILYTVLIVGVSCFLSRLGVLEDKQIYTLSGLILFYLISLFAWVSLGIKGRVDLEKGEENEL